MEKHIGNYHINLNVWHLGSGLVLIQSAKNGVSGVCNRIQQVVWGLE